VQLPTAKEGATRPVPQTKAAGVPAALFLQPRDGDNGFVVQYLADY